MKRSLALLAAGLFLSVVPVSAGQAASSAIGEDSPPRGAPAATIDLMTQEGVRLTQGEWRYSDTRIIEVTHRAPGSDGQPTGDPVRTYDYEPHAGPADFDDSGWAVIEPKRSPIAGLRGACASIGIASSSPCRHESAK